MDKENLTFTTPNNFKKGKYIFSMYKLQDFLILVGIMVMSFLTLILIAITNPEGLSLMTLFTLLVIGGIPFMLFFPLGSYFNLITFIKVWIKYRRKRKEYKWYGISFEQETEEEN